MKRQANIYDICDRVILREQPAGEPGENLQLLYKTAASHFLLKTIILKSCRHPAIPATEIPKYQEMMRAAMRATPQDWQNPDWIDTTFCPLATLLDQIPPRKWQLREKMQPATSPPMRQEIVNAWDVTMRDIRRVWKRHRRDPYFPVAAQVIIAGDDHMDGTNFLNVLRGLGSFEYQNITLIFSFIRCFLHVNPQKMKLIRIPFRGVCEQMNTRMAWIWHRTAYYDAIFFEFLYTCLTTMKMPAAEQRELVSIMENLLRFMVVTSYEWSTTPNEKIKHPTITCLPKDADGKPLCRMSRSDWQKKLDLGFGDFVPDTDTTFMSLAMAKKWLELVATINLQVDQQLLEKCQQILNYPYVDIIAEYQVGGDYNSNPPTIQITKPLDYYGSIPIWFDKPFTKKDGKMVRETLGNEICPGHNMDILASILVNRFQWQALSGKNLETVQRLLEFHYRAYTSGKFKRESAHKYYLPEIYLYYTGRLYDVYQTLTTEEQKLLDPEGKVATIRKIAIAYVKDELLGYTLNPFDAALAVSALVLLGHENREDGAVATGLKIILEALGEGDKGHPFKAYEWNRMRHPTRIIVGSDVSTSFFVMNALVLGQKFFYSD